MARIKNALESLLDDLDVNLALRRHEHETITTEIDKLERQRGVVSELIGAQA